MEKHKNTCSKDCEFATKVVLLSWAGQDQDWLYKCTKIDQIITTDSAIIKLGCATYSQKLPQVRPESEKAGDLVEESKELLKKIHKQIEENKQKAPVIDQGQATQKPPEVKKPEIKPVQAQVSPLAAMAMEAAESKQLLRQALFERKTVVVTPPSPAPAAQPPQPPVSPQSVPVQKPLATVPDNEVPIQRQIMPEPVKQEKLVTEPVPKKRGRKPKPAVSTVPTAAPAAVVKETVKEPIEKQESQNIPPKP